MGFDLVLRHWERDSIGVLVSFEFRHCKDPGANFRLYGPFLLQFKPFQSTEGRLTPVVSIERRVSVLCVTGFL